MTRRNRDDWLLAGVAILARHGRDGLKLEALCERLGVTRGSFYHHFDDLGDYRRQLLEHYRQEGTHRLIEIADREPTARARLERLLETIVEFTDIPQKNPEPAIRAWALQDAEVRAVQGTIDEHRLEYVAALLRELQVPPARARLLSEYLYALLIGCEQLQPAVAGERLRELFDLYLKMLDHTHSPEKP
jgi:AcrR family transcriptional regulator